MMDHKSMEQLGQMINGVWVSRMICTAAELGLADRIASGVHSVYDLARDTETVPDNLFRLLRALAGVGIFAEQEPRRFVLTPLAELLRSDVPGSMLAWARMMGGEHYTVWGELMYSLKTGKIAFDKIYGMPIFEFFSRHPEQATIFDAAMVSIHGRETNAMLATYDFAGIKTLADVGGGNGSLITAVLKKYPHLRGMLYDLPGVIERARDGVFASGVGDRLQLLTGDFFQAVPSGADAYLMRHIIHDWTDEQSITILRNCRAALGDQGKLLLIEMVIPPGNEPSFGKLLDINMMLLPGGKERTEEEYRALFDASGFKLTQIVPTGGGIDVIEAVPV